MGFLEKLFGFSADKEIRRIQPILNQILAYDEEMQALSDEELKAKTPYFKERLAAGETLDDIMPEAFATVREAAWRVLGEKHYPVQLEGGIILHQGRIAEIVGAKSNERRDIFEEAAGISKFRYKKAEAERKLIAAQENLVRLTDILAELESRIGPLKSQSEKAEKFVKLAEQRKKLEISVWVNRLDELRDKLEKLDEKILVSRNEYENI